MLQFLERFVDIEGGSNSFRKFFIKLGKKEGRHELKIQTNKFHS